ncbi:VIT domain-containing protein [Vitiosangium sp. GDMCC 1.1324]|uniref:VIT domain-containing protein n=1 Tax=Vitiosangium sp. (strain GDMCC 1.1324) TaxID=2138576 RepID=UPI000D3D8F2F|nr:VIT domain-containing protein [Vitiosangium sp. GDMCC 1.1324]PTL81513.1 VWA domain-containing protein [Vitiosangium sp. GDMCC 1.1324]
MENEKAGLYTQSGAQVPLQGVDVSGELLGGHARVRVRQRYRNTEPKPVEAVYVFPLPSDATLTAFSMECAGRRVQGILKERDEAFRAYDDAVTAGHGAALLDQERPNVFTAQVGNLLPGEETLVEVEFLQAIQIEEGCVRWALPTLVAPRYIPGTPSGDRSAHGWADPTNRVPDADRITPPVGDARYGLTLDLLISLGREVVVESPSHKLDISRAENGTRVKLSQPNVALDRDLVLSIRGQDMSTPLTTLVTHRKGEQPGTFALTVVPDLLGMAAGPKRQEVVFVVDTSGSMGGESLPQAQGALRLCLRHLREGDRFNIIAFNDSFQLFSKEPVTFTQKTLEQADRWVAALHASGGTELLQPMVAAVQAVPEGVVVLLTDGQVGNESEILNAVMGARKTARIYSFGIGTNVSDVLLKDMARQTGGAVEFIHPGERIDDKVVAQFSRALAPRVTGVEVRFEGVEASELAPAEPPQLVDGTPWSLFGRYTSPGSGKVVLKGKSGAETFSLSIPVSFPAESDRPAVEKLWAAERIRAWQDAALVGRRAQSLKERIVQLALAHGIVTPYTSFVVVEERTGERRASGQPETRVVPVHAPAGWDMFGTAKQEEGAAAPASAGGAARSRMPSKKLSVHVGSAPPMAPGAIPPMAQAPAPAYAPPPLAPTAASVAVAAGPGGSADKSKGSLRLGKARKEMAPAPEPIVESEQMASMDFMELERAEEKSASDGGVGLLEQQLASGLWAGTGTGPEPVRQARATALALLELLRQGITSSHALHGAQVKKAVEALLALVPQLSGAPDVAELVLGVAWLVAAGPRTRGRIAQAAQPIAGLSSRLENEVALRQHVDALAAR